MTTLKDKMKKMDEDMDTFTDLDRCIIYGCLENIEIRNLNRYKIQMLEMVKILSEYLNKL